MKTISITPPITIKEKNEEQGGPAVITKDLDKAVFDWKSYLKQERNHNLALALFTK